MRMAVRGGPASLDPVTQPRLRPALPTPRSPQWGLAFHPSEICLDIHKRHLRAGLDESTCMLVRIIVNRCQKARLPARSSASSPSQIEMLNVTSPKPVLHHLVIMLCHREFFQSVTMRLVGNRTRLSSFSPSTISFSTSALSPWNKDGLDVTRSAASAQIRPWLSGRLALVRLALSLTSISRGKVSSYISQIHHSSSGGNFF